MNLRLRDQVRQLVPGAPLIMGIVNIGEDSVADSLHLRTFEQQLRFALEQHEAGAHIVDIGVQSGRTDTELITEDEEIRRLLPLTEALVGEGVTVSIDTWRSPVVRAVLEAGASMINDVSGLADAAVADLVASFGAGLVVMHTRAAPKVERFPRYEDPVADIVEYLGEKIAAARARGVDGDQIVVDPGLDFAKTPETSIVVLRRLEELRRFGRPILLAVSRKYFIGMVTGSGPEHRLGGTLAALDFGVTAGAHIVRVHDVDAVVQYLSMRQALRTNDTPAFRGDPRDDSLKWLSPKAEGG